MALALAGGLHAACFDGAESTATAFTMSSLWHIVDAASVSCAGAHSGSHAFYFGIDSQCNYDNGAVKDGALTTPPFYVSGVGDTNFSFWTKWQVESLDPGCYDQLYLEYLILPSGSWTQYSPEIGPPSPPSNAPGSSSLGIASLTGLGGVPGWVFVQRNLAFLAGNTVRIRFRFASSACLLSLCNGKTYCGPPDSDFDNFLGWVVDDISYGCNPADLTLAKSALPAFAPQGGAVTYVLTAKNLDAASQSLSVWDTLPPGAQFVSANPSAAVAGQFLSWLLPSVPSQASQAITVAVTVDPSLPYPTDWWNTASGRSAAGGQGFTSQASLVKIRGPKIVISKSAQPTVLTSGDQVTFTISVSNFTPSTITQIDISETYPVGFVELGSYPSYSSYRSWKASAVMPGDTRYFTVWGFANGFNGQVLTNRAEAFVSGSSQGSATASVKLIRPEVPQLSIKAVYPNPAPSGKPGLPQSAFVVFDANQAMELTLDIYTVAGEKIRSIPFRAGRGVGQVEWDLKNNVAASVSSGVYVARLWVSVAQLGLVEAWAHIAVLQ